MNKSKSLNEMNVLITGITGFIGGNLARGLIKAGANVFGLVRNKSQNNLIAIEGFGSKITLVYGDLCDSLLMERILSENGITHIYHLAAQVEVGVAYINPFLTFESNIRGTYCLLEAARKYSNGIKSIVVASTDKAYGEYAIEDMPYQEDYPLIPRYPYDVSKACADLIAQSYSKNYGLPIVVTRFCNIYGPGQLNFSALFPDSIRCALGHGSFIPRGDGTQLRDFIYVDDVVKLYLVISEALEKNPEKFSGEIYNAGTNNPISVKDALKLVFNITSQIEKFHDIEARFKSKLTTGEISAQFMTYQKPYAHFSWKPTYGLEAGLSKTIDWYRKYFSELNESK